ncbi:hypothetical protein ASC63_14660 [Leifsonia sp. Root112D2]|nr:hypothetical protein ASC63_14660 [Leifsonia sp. Root112D2]
MGFEDRLDFGVGLRVTTLLWEGIHEVVHAMKGTADVVIPASLFADVSNEAGHGTFEAEEFSRGIAES